MQLAIMGVGMLIGLSLAPRVVAGVVQRVDTPGATMILHAAGWTMVLIGALLP